MLNLEVQVSSEPVIEEGALNVAGGMHLQFNPRLSLIRLDIHGHVVGLGHPGEPVALQTPAHNAIYMGHSHHDATGLGHPGEPMALQTPAHNAFIWVTAIMTSLDWAIQVNQWLSRHLQTTHFIWVTAIILLDWAIQVNQWLSRHLQTTHSYRSQPSYRLTGLSRWISGSPDTCRQHIHTGHSHHILGLGYPGTLVALQTPADNTFIQVTAIISLDWAIQVN